MSSHDTAREGSPKYAQQEDGTPYGLAYVERETGRVLAAESDRQRHALRWAAFRLAGVHAEGEVSRAHAVAALMSLPPRLGLTSEQANDEVVAGWRAGLTMAAHTGVAG